MNSESCSLEEFDTFELNEFPKLIEEIFDDSFLNDLKHEITYKYKNHSTVSFLTSKNFKLLSFDIYSKPKVDLKTIKFEIGESEIQLGKCYMKCGYLGDILKFRTNKKEYGKSFIPKIKLLSTSINKKIIDTDYVYVEGIIQNFGFYINGQEFIFLPLENSSFKPIENYYVKIFLIEKGKKIVVNILYSSKKIDSNIIKYIYKLSEKT